MLLKGIVYIRSKRSVKAIDLDEKLSIPSLDTVDQ